MKTKRMSMRRKMDGKTKRWTMTIMHKLEIKKSMPE